MKVEDNHHHQPPTVYNVCANVAHCTYTQHSTISMQGGWVLTQRHLLYIHSHLYSDTENKRHVAQHLKCVADQYSYSRSSYILCCWAGAMLKNEKKWNVMRKLCQIKTWQKYEENCPVVSRIPSWLPEITPQYST